MRQRSRPTLCSQDWPKLKLLTSRGPIYNASYDSLTIILRLSPKLRSTYDGHLIYKYLTKNARLFKERFTRKIVKPSDMVLVKWLTMFLREILAHCKPVSYVDLAINSRQFHDKTPRPQFWPPDSRLSEFESRERDREREFLLKTGLISRL